MQNELQKLNHLVRGMGISQMIGAICEAGVPDELDIDETRPVSSIARKLKINEEVLLRICRALSSFGFFSIENGQYIRHNDLSSTLRTDHARSQHWAARFWTSPGIWNAWGALRHSLQTGQESFKHVHQQQFFSYMDEHVDEVNVYQRYMSQGYAGRHATVADNIHPGTARLIIDVGGGKGTLMREILNRHPDIYGIVYDQDGIAAPSAETDPRLSFISGNFFDAVPTGGNIYILSWVLHDWPDDQALTILHQCRKAMLPGARLIIIERIISDNIADCDSFDLLLDIHMLVLHNGKERTFSAFQALLQEAGLHTIKATFKHPAFSIIEAVVS